MYTTKLVVCALFTALIAVLAQVSIQLPFSPVPFTGQLFGVLLAGILLGKRFGVLSVIAYLLLGAAGAPIFSLGRGGLFILLGPTGGYLWGFIPAAYFSGLTTEKNGSLSMYRTAAALISAIILIYLCGILQLIMVMRYSIIQAVVIGAIPFLPLDLLKAFLVGAFAYKIRKSLQQYGLSHIIS